MISYDQEIKIKNFIEHFRSKQKVRGEIHITICDDFYSIDHEVFTDSDVDEAEQIGFQDGVDHLEDIIEKMNGIDLSEFISEEQSLELYEYYKDKRK